MLKQLIKIQKGGRGFTLIELMIVVSVIGILAIIAIPQFVAYRQHAYNSTAESDLRNFKTAMEIDFGDHQEYDDQLKQCNMLGCTTNSNASESGNPITLYKTSNGVAIVISASSSAFAAQNAHKSGTRQFGIASNVGAIYWKKYTSEGSDYTAILTSNDATAFDATWELL